MCVDKFPHKSLGVHINVFPKKLKVVQHRDRKKYADIAYYGLYNRNNMSKRNLYLITFQKTYTLLRLALIVCTQLPLEQKHQSVQ